MAIIRYLLFISVVSLLVCVTACDMTEKESKSDDAEGPDLVELNNEIPFGQKTIQGFRYTTLDKFINAKNTDDLWD